MSFEELAKKLNKLMNEAEIFDEAKPIPYLGWWWRNISADTPRLVLSWLGGHWWIDEARKWDYPSRIVEEEEAIAILECCIKIIEAQLELAKLLAEAPPG